MTLDTIFNEDCLEGMKRIPDASVDCIITDLPYGTTDCAWDSVIPLDRLWDEYDRLSKPNAPIVLFGSEPFSTMLRMSNLKAFKYDWIWDKVFGGNFVLAKYQPIKTHEIISVFCSNGQCPTYNPIMIKRDVPIKAGGNTQKEGKAIKIAQTEHSKEFGEAHKTYDEKFPESQLRFSCRAERGLHPTQKPVALLRYLVLTYTNEGDTVLDSCMGSGTTAIACIKEHRHFLGFEINKEYFNIAQRRIALERQQPSLDFTDGCPPCPNCASRITYLR